MLNDRIVRLLKKIEWKGPADYSIGVRTCPCCGRRGNVRKESQWYQGHSDTCDLKNFINELTDNRQINRAQKDAPVNSTVVRIYEI